MTVDRDLVFEQELCISVDTSRGVHEVRLAGELDLATAPQLRRVLAPLVGAAVVIDMTDLSFIDCTGLSVLVLAMGGPRAKRHLSVRGARGVVRRVIDRGGLGMLLEDAPFS